MSITSDQERHKWKSVVTKLSNLVDDQTIDLFYVLEESEKLINNYLDYATPPYSQSNVDALLECMSSIESRLEGKLDRRPRGDLLNYLANNLLAGEVVYLCGGVGVGKTTLTTCIARQFLYPEPALTQSRHLGWVTFQEIPMHLMLRLTAIRGKMSLDELKYGKISRQAFNELYGLYGGIHDKQLTFSHALHLSPYEIAPVVRQMGKEVKLDLVLIDGYPLFELNAADQKKLHRCLQTLAYWIKCPIIFTVALPDTLMQNFTVSAMASALNMSVHDINGVFRLARESNGTFLLSTEFLKLGFPEVTKLDFDPVTVSFRKSVVTL